MLRHLFSLLFLVGSLTLASGVARAQDASLETARLAFEKGQALFDGAKFDEAAVQFEAALAARPYPQFLFNIGACHEKLADYPKAIDYYKRYLAASPGAADKKKTEKRIEALDKAIAELAATPPTTDPDDPNAPPPTAEPPKALVGLEAATIKGIVVIVSNPPDATIYLDSKKGRPLSKTPWNGELTGEHTIYVEREGYKPGKEKISPAADRFVMVHFALGEDDYLGWLDITANVEQADIYIDDRAVGVRNKTPWGGNLPPGKHTIWVTKEGYDEFVTELEVVRGKTHKINATLKGAPVGYLSVRGGGIEKTRILLDGKVLCERGPCIKAVAQGVHEVTIERDGYKPYAASIDVQAKTETTVRAQLAVKPSRLDAIVAYAFAGAFIGGGVWAGKKAASLEDELAADIEAGAPPPDEDDPRFLRGKVYSIVADASYLLGGASLLAAVYYTFRDKGAPSTGTTDIRAVQAQRFRWSPEAAPGYAGVGMEVRW